MNDCRTPLVSLIVRSMGRPTLGQTLASVAAQTHCHIEVIVVNAKGADHQDPGESCGRFPLRFVNQAGLPLSRSQAANVGLGAACGQYVAFLDDDDALDADHFSNLISAIQAHPDCVVYAGVRCIDKSDPEQKVSRIFGQPLESVAQLLAGNFIPIHAPLFPRYLLQHARYDETLATYEDWDFWLQLAQHARFIYTNRVTATYYTGGTSGVSPQAPDWDAVRQATRALFEKWMRLTPDDFKKICDLYHQSSADLQQSRRENEQLTLQIVDLQRELAQTQQQRDLAQQQFQAIRSSTTWAMTQPLRWLKTLINQLRTGAKG